MYDNTVIISAILFQFNSTQQSNFLDWWLIEEERLSPLSFLLKEEKQPGLRPIAAPQIEIHSFSFNLLRWRPLAARYRSLPSRSIQPPIRSIHFSSELPLKLVGCLSLLSLPAPQRKSWLYFSWIVLSLGWIESEKVGYELTLLLHQTKDN